MDISVNRKLISIIIPVFNEEQNIPLLYKELLEVLSTVREKYDYEIIFVNDGSKDKSGQIIQSLINFNPRVRYIEFSRNFGKEIALTAGLEYSQGDAGIMIDADLQHPLELIPQFLEKWEKGAEIVVGLKKRQQKEKLIRRLSTFLFYWTIRLIGESEINLQSTDYRLLDKKVIREFKNLKERNRITRGLIDWLGFKKDYIYFETQKRSLGKSQLDFKKLTKFCLSGFVSHSLFPLKFAGYLGIFITIFAGLLGGFVVLNKYVLNDFFKLNISGTAMLAVFILFLIGIVLICLGLIALYIADIHKQVSGRPMYIIRKKKNFNNSKQEIF